MFYEFVSAGAHGLVFKIPIFFNGFLGDDVVLIHLVLPQHIDIIGDKFHCGGVDDVDFFQRLGKFCIAHRAVCRVQIVVIREFDVFCRDFDFFIEQAVSSLPIYVVTDLDRPSQAVFAALPFCSQGRHEIGLLIHLYQGVIDLPQNVTVAVGSGLPGHQGGHGHVCADHQFICILHHFA